MKQVIFHTLLNKVKRAYVRGEGSVAQGVVGVGVRFEEETVCPECLGGQCHRGNVLAVAARLAASRSGTLHAVGAIHHHAVGVLLHEGDVAEVNYKVVVAVDIASLREPHLLCAGFAAFLDGILHVVAREELRLLHVHDAARLRSGHEQVGLPAQESGDLQNVGHLARCGGLAAFVNVRQDRKSKLRLDVGEHLHALFKPRSSERMYRGAVGFVERSFEIYGCTRLLLDACKFLCHGLQDVHALYDARSGDKYWFHRIRFLLQSYVKILSNTLYLLYSFIFVTGFLTIG